MLILALLIRPGNLYLETGIGKCENIIFLLRLCILSCCGESCEPSVHLSQIINQRRH